MFYTRSCLDVVRLAHERESVVAFLSARGRPRRATRAASHSTSFAHIALRRLQLVAQCHYPLDILLSRGRIARSAAARARARNASFASVNGNLLGARLKAVPPQAARARARSAPASLL